MTVPSVRSKEALTPGRLLFGLFALFCLLLILRNSDTAIEYMSRGLLLCARTVIPSLFPFMVLSELLVSGGFGELVLSRICAPFRFLFRLPTAGCCAILLGVLCGFPVGARCAALAYDRGELTRAECQQVVACSGTPSSAFLISAVGVSLWGNRLFGICLYAVAVGVTLLFGILLGHLRSKEYHDERPPAQPIRTGATLFTTSVRSATESMLLVCAYVVFFSALTGTLNLLLSQTPLPDATRAVITALFELSSGVSLAATLSNGYFAAILCAATVGWSGLSVHCQILAVCDGRGFSFRSYFVVKLLQSVLCALIMALLCRCFPTLLLPGAHGVNAEWYYLLP